MTLDDDDDDEISTSNDLDSRDMLRCRRLRNVRGILLVQLIGNILCAA